MQDSLLDPGRNARLTGGWDSNYKLQGTENFYVLTRSLKGVFF